MRENNKMIRKRLIGKLYIFICLLAILLILPSKAYALSNGLNFVDEGKNPLAVTVTYYDDIYSRGFAWTTMEATTDSVVQIMKKTDDVNWDNAKTIYGSYVESDEYFCHKAYVQNLENDESYIYRVGSITDNIFSDSGNITIYDGSKGIKFLFATDPQDYDEAGFTIWSNLVAAAYQTMPDANFFACGGDIVNDSHDSLSHDYDQWIYALDLPKEYFTNSIFVPTSGNHDTLGTSFCDRFTIDYQGSTLTGGYYSYNLGNMHFTVLNTNESDNLTTQIEWLKKDLEEAKDYEWKIVLLHKGLLSTGDHSNDSDVLELRAALVPLMARYSVDLVLQGHDHVYVRTTPYYYGLKDDGDYYTGKVPNKEETLITEVDGDTSITYSVEPNGTFYVTGNYCGRKSYATVSYDTTAIFPAINPYNDAAMSLQIEIPTFCTIEINDNKLEFNTYLYDGATIRLYDTYNVLKNTYVEVENHIDDLPSVDKATILDFEEINEVYLQYDKLVPLAKKKMNGDSITKIEALIEKYPLKDSAKAYVVAKAIDELSLESIDLSDELRVKLKTIKAQYNDLTDNQKILVENYARIDEIEEIIDDLYVVNAFNNLLSDYNNNLATDKEVTRAYKELTEAQAQKVNINDFKLVEITEPISGCQGTIISNVLTLLIALIGLAFIQTIRYLKKDKVKDYGKESL